MEYQNNHSPAQHDSALQVTQVRFHLRGQESITHGVGASHRVEKACVLKQHRLQPHDQNGELSVESRNAAGDVK